MKKLKQMLQALIILGAAILPIQIMYNKVGPFLWAGQSSVAHLACITLWLISIGFAIFGTILAHKVWKNGWNRQPKTVHPQRPRPRTFNQ